MIHKHGTATLATAVLLAGVLLAHGQAQESNRADLARQRLSQVRVAVLYENLTDGVSLGRSKEATIKLLKETRADFVLRCFWKWQPVLESADRIPPQLLELANERGVSEAKATEALRQSGHTYASLKEWIGAIKRELPSLIFCGAIPAQTISRIEWNPITGRAHKPDETWQMALDPQKWKIERDGKTLTREAFQEKWYGVHPYGAKRESYDRSKVTAYFPDITNPDFQELLLSWAKKQIDCGADAIWIDMLYTQAVRLAQITRNVEHPAVKESVQAAVKIVDEIHRYGAAKGRYIWVGSWDGALFTLTDKFPYRPPAVDFVTVSPTVEEVLQKKLNTEHWTKRMAGIRTAYGNNVPVFAYIDWAFDDSQTVMFSQKLSQEEQRETLRNFDRSFQEVGINFVYPLHGGYIGRGSVTTKLAFAKHRIYDSLAPEFDTYGAIKELARRKATSR